jgi:hypothetical protein
MPSTIQQVILAREYLKDVVISPDQVKYLVEESRRGGVQVRGLLLLHLGRGCEGGEGGGGGESVQQAVYVRCIKCWGLMLGSCRGWYV